MSLRFIGATIVFASCSATGFLIAANVRKETNLLAEMHTLLNDMQNELQYRLTPIPTICEMAAKDATGCLRRVFTELYQVLLSNSSSDVSACMQDILQTATDLPPRLRKVLLALGRSFGKFDLEGQLSELTAVRQLCQEELSQMQDRQDVRLRSFRTMGICIGAGLAILLF